MVEKTNSTGDSIDVFVIDKVNDQVELNKGIISNLLNEGGQSANVRAFSTQERGLAAISEAYGARPDLDLVILTGVEGNAIGTSTGEETSWSETDTRNYIDQIKQASGNKARIIIYTGGNQVTRRDARNWQTSGYIFKGDPDSFQKIKYAVTAARHDIYWDIEDLQSKVRIRIATKDESNVEGYRTALSEMGKEMLRLSETPEGEMDYRQNISKALRITQSNISKRNGKSQLGFSSSVIEGLDAINSIFIYKNFNPTKSFYQALGNSLLYAAENFDKPNQ